MVDVSKLLNKLNRGFDNIQKLPVSHWNRKFFVSLLTKCLSLLFLKALPQPVFWEWGGNGYQLL